MEFHGSDFMFGKYMGTSMNELIEVPICESMFSHVIFGSMAKASLRSFATWQQYRQRR